MGFFTSFKKFRQNKKRGIVKSHRTEDIAPSTDMIVREWEKIQALITQKGPSQLRQALISADKSLDNALKSTFGGGTMADRLKAARNKFDPPLYDKIWKAHKMRNSLVHESGFEPPAHMIITAVETLKKAVQKLGIKIR